MNRDIISRKRKYEPLDLSWDDRLDLMFERRWTFGTWCLAIALSALAIAVLWFLGIGLLGLN